MRGAHRDLYTLNFDCSTRTDVYYMIRAKAMDRDAVESSRFHQLEASVSDTARLLGTNALGTQDKCREAMNGDRWEIYEDSKVLSWWQRPSVYWLLFPFTVFTLAFGGVMVPKLNLILDLVCKQYLADQKFLDPNITFNAILLGSDNSQCKIPGVQKNAATFMLVMNLITGLLSAIVTPKLGHLSDRYGRTRLMALASCGGLVAEFITILVARFPQVIDYRWLVLGSVFDGLTGSFTAGSILHQSYISDCTPPSKRAASIGYMHACLFTGLAFGPLLAGYFAKWTGSLLSIFYVVLGCHSMFVIVIRFIVPESLPKKKQLLAREKWDKEQELRAQTRRSLLSTIQTTNPFEPLKVLSPTGPGTSPALRRNLVALALNDIIIFGISQAAGAVIILYSEYMYGWGTFESSRFVSVLSLVRVAALMGVFPIINYFGRVRPAARRRRDCLTLPAEKHYGADSLDIWVLRAALTSDILGSIGYSLAHSEKVFFLSGMVTAMGGLGSAIIQATITKHVPSNRVGQLLGAVGMLLALSRILGPLLFNGIYAATVGTFPQAIFVLLASLYGISFLASFAIRPHVHWDDEQEETRPLSPGQQKYNARTNTLPIDEERVHIQ
ncbi:major facilitator superfamily domain-containing protein [Fusarium oxysporum]|nr:major facilitator superfamily domain-containing protein [Fusarium oxysporum]